VAIRVHRSSSATEEREMQEFFFDSGHNPLC
jgi:hypothetical protein